MIKCNKLVDTNATDIQNNRMALWYKIGGYVVLNDISVTLKDRSHTKTYSTDSSLATYIKL